jgi:acyl-CoA oxidase
MTSNDATGLTPLGASLRAALDGRWGHVRQDARDRLSLEDFSSPPGLDIQAHRARIHDQLRRLADSGRLRDGFPTEYGGRNDIGAAVTGFEMLAYVDLSLLVKAGVHWGLFGGAVANLGTAVHHDRYLADIIAFDLPGCFAMTEVGHGSDVQSLQTTATYDDSSGELVVHTPHEGATKTYIGGAARDGRLAVVFAQLVSSAGGHGVHAVLVPIRDGDGNALPGVTIGDCGVKGGLGGVDNGTLRFRHVRVPREALLDRYGGLADDGTYSSPIENETRRFFTMLGTLVRGRVSVAGAAGSATKSALSIATRYALQRRQFPHPDGGEVLLLDYRAHQRKLLPAIATSYALHFAQGEVVSALHDVQTASGVTSDERAQREVESRAAGLKAVGTWHATRTIQMCREACGGAGYLAENRLPVLMADTDVFTTFEGDNTVLLQLVAKGLLTSYRDAFGDLDMVGTVRFGARQIADAVIERTAARSLIRRLIDATPGRDDDADLLDRGLHLRMFEDREKHVLEGLARRLRRAGGSGADAFTVFNEAQDHVLTAARVHVERIVLEAFVAGIDACDDPEARAALVTLCDLFVMSNLEADKGWLLEHDRLTPARSKAVTGQVNRLCAELRPVAKSLVEGFGIPVEWLGAPIAF